MTTTLEVAEQLADELYGLHCDIGRLEVENAKLRKLVRGLMYCADEACGMCARTPVGGEEPFTCCPLYDFDAREYRCVELKRELGLKVNA